MPSCKLCFVECITHVAVTCFPGKVHMYTRQILLWCCCVRIRFEENNDTCTL